MMMFVYDFGRLNGLLKAILQRNLTPEAWAWLAGEGLTVRTKGDVAKFNVAFVMMPRKTGKDVVTLSINDEAELESLRNGLHIRGWTVDRLSRVWLLLQLNADDRNKLAAAIENLFLAAEMSELVALYGALPLLPYPEVWRKRCAEGIRSNIGRVLESIICNNPYPAEQLDEAAWNQLVLKAIFTEQPVLEISGLEARRNANLAQALTDYAHERWAAHRGVNPLLWICVSPFIDSGNFSDIQRVFQSEDPAERDAAALTCYESNFAPARKLVAENEAISRGIKDGRISWQTVADQMRSKG